MSRYDLLLCNRIAQVTHRRQLSVSSKRRIRDLIRNMSSAFPWKGLRAKSEVLN